jgi:hypothetical protein
LLFAHASAHALVALDGKLEERYQKAMREVEI